MTGRRIWAYIIDLFFITVVLNMVNNISFLNPRYDDYLESVDKYYEMMDNITEDDYNLNLEEISKLNYDINYYGLSYLVIRLVVYSAYFIGFQAWNKGQTLGKKLMKVKILNKDDTPISLGKLALREIILYGLYSDALNILCLFIFKNIPYLFSSFILETLSSNITIISMIFILWKKDHQGLHDIFTKTKVVRE